MSVSRELVRNLTRPVGRSIEGGQEGSDPDVTIENEMLWSDGTQVLWSDEQSVAWSS